MRVLLTHRPGGAFGFISEGWLNALRLLGHVAERWDGRRDSWDAFKPDVYFGCSGHRQQVPPKSERTARVAIHVNPRGDIEIPGINEPQGTVDWTEAQQPDVVFGYGHEGDRKYWAGWDRSGLPWVPMPTAADSVAYAPWYHSDRATQNPPSPPRDWKVSYIGGYWPYKAKNIDQYLLPLLRAVADRHVFGWGDWPAWVAAQPIDDASVPYVLGRTKVGPCVVEPHTTKWGIDLPERVFKVAACGALAINDPAAGLERFIPGVVTATNPQDYVQKAFYYLERPKERDELAREQQQHVLVHHTYVRRVGTLFSAIRAATGDPRFPA